MTNKTKFRLFMKIDKVERKLKKNIKKNMQEVILGLVGFTKDIMNVSNEGGKNPSEPGDIPHVGKGSAGLKGSIDGKVFTDGKIVVGQWGVMRGVATDYAMRLEFGYYGTDGKGRNVSQEPRPFLEPVYREKRDDIFKKLLEG